MGIGRIVPGGGTNRGEGMQERWRGRKTGKHDDYRPYVCVFFEREGAERKKGPPAKSREKERKKKRSVKSPTHKTFFLYYAKHPFSIPQGGEDRSPHPPDHLSNDHEQGADSQQAARAKGESSAGGRR